MRAAVNSSTNIGPVRIKAAELSDLDGMVFCHIAAFPGRFMTKMGPHWLEGLYSYFIKHDKAISLVAVDVSGKVLGFAVGGKTRVKKEFLRRAFIRYPHIILWRFLTSSLVRKRLVGLLFRKLGKLRADRSASNAAASESKATNVTNYGVLMSIAVYPKYQGTGIAGRLIESFREVSAERGYKILILYVINDNLRAIAFYKKHKWYEVSKLENSTEFRLDLTDK
jgi:ribosomal protein S18 acetylase RimI-like enzyme